MYLKQNVTRVKFNGLFHLYFEEINQVVVLSCSESTEARKKENAFQNK